MDSEDDLHRLDEALKQIRLLRDGIDDDALETDLQDAAETLTTVRRELDSDTDG